MKNYSKAIVVIIIFALSLLLLFRVSAILGGIVYLLAFGISLLELKSKVNYEDSFSIMGFIKNIKRETFFTEGIFTIIVIILPVMIVVCSYRWIVSDTIREVDNLFK